MLRIVVREISQIEPGEPGSCSLTGVLGSRGEDFEGFPKPEAAPEPAGLATSDHSNFASARDSGSSLRLSQVSAAPGQPGLPS